MTIERFIETTGPDKGRVKDVDVAWDLADTEDAWRDENDGKPMLSPPERLGKSNIHFRDIVNRELKRLIEVRLAEELNQGFDSVYGGVSRDDDPENSDERWLSYRIANKLASLGEEHGFDDQTCYEIYEMPFAEAFEAAYGYLTQAGLDADTILAEFMESTATQ